MFLALKKEIKSASVNRGDLARSRQLGKNPRGSDVTGTLLIYPARVRRHERDHSG